MVVCQARPAGSSGLCRDGASRYGGCRVPVYRAGVPLRFRAADSEALLIVAVGTRSRPQREIAACWLPLCGTRPARQPAGNGAECNDTRIASRLPAGLCRCRGAVSSTLRALRLPRRQAGEEHDLALKARDKGQHCCPFAPNMADFNTRHKAWTASESRFLAARSSGARQLMADKKRKSGCRNGHPLWLHRRGRR